MIKQFKRLFMMLLFLPVSLMIFGQGATTSGINGRVLDSAGQPMPGASVVALHVPSGTQYATTTDVKGNYRIQNMRVGGPYTIKITFIGYLSSSYTDVILKLGESYVQDAVLSESTTTLQEVIVSSGTRNYSILSSERSGTQTNVSSRDLASLPTISRSITDFTKLTPQSQGNSFGGVMAVLIQSLSMEQHSTITSD